MTKILIIEDEAAIRQMFKAQLASDGYEVAESWNGKEGVEKAKSEHPDLILMDIVMPEQTGIDALKELRSDPATRAIPVIMLTNVEQEDLIRESLSWGAASYIVKSSIIPKELSEKVKQALSARPDKTPA